MRVLARADYEVDAIERRPECEAPLQECGAKEVIIGDALELVPKTTTKSYVGNPPFEDDQGFKFVKACVESGAPYVAMLVQLDFLNTPERGEWLNRNPITQIIAFQKRPSFTGNGVDSRNYCWLIWEREQAPRAPYLLPPPLGSKVEE